MKLLLNIFGEYGKQKGSKSENAGQGVQANGRGGKVVNCQSFAQTDSAKSFNLMKIKMSCTMNKFPKSRPMPRLCRLASDIDLRRFTSGEESQAKASVKHSEQEVYNFPSRSH
jgi:hypothetical protein